MGDWNILSLKEPLPYVEIGIASITIHPDYNNKTGLNNIAIIRLTEMFSLGEYPTITSGCLPSE